MDAEKHLYDSLKSFVVNLDDESHEVYEKYRDLLYFKELFKKAQNSIGENKRPTKEVYEADIIFKQFCMSKIEIICLVCNRKKLLALSKDEVVEWFFFQNVPLVMPYETNC